MARTVNRSPLSVSTSLSNKDYFFNQANWKGMSDDKNFLTADQETFESCKNVYVDTEGLLRSRPSLKVSNEMNVVNFWSVGEFVIVLSKTADKRYDLYVSNINDGRNVTTAGTDYFYTEDKVKPLQIEDKIFLLSPNSFRYINTKGEMKIGDAEKFVYTPETRVYTSSVNQQESEPKNLLTDDEIFTYIYNSRGQNLDFVVGKDVYFTMLDKVYEVKFSSLTPLTLLKKLPIVKSSPNCIYDVFAGETGDSIALIDPATRQFLYSVNGSTWNMIKTIPGNKPIRSGRFTQDGQEFYCKTKSEDPDDPYEEYYIVSVAIGVVSDNVSDYRFPLFVNYDDIINLPTGAHNLYLVTWDRGACMYSREGTGNDYFYAFLSDSKSNSFDIGNLSDTDGTLYMFTNFIPERHIIFLSQGFRGALSYCVFDDLLNITSSPSYVGFPGGSGDIKWPDNLTRNSSRIVFTYWNGDTLTQYLVDNNLNTELLYQYPVAKDTQLAVNKDGTELMTTTKFCKNGISTDLLERPSVLVGAGTYFYSCYESEGFDGTSIYSNDVSSMTFKEDIDGPDKKLYEFLTKVFDGNVVHTELDEIYLSVADDLVISAKRHDDEGNRLLYFPDINAQKFTSNITGLQPISTSEVAIFLPNEVWYSKLTEAGYTYTKSKLQVGLREGSDVITSYDGTQVIFPSERGLVALTYQNFVASTDQSLTFMSDAIHTQFVKFTEGPVKLLRYQYWILCYKNDSKESFLLDLRNGSWWPMEIFKEPIKALDVDNHVVVLMNNHLHKLNKTDEDYFDYSSGKHFIDWYVTSQKLHLNAVNHVKHIANITLMSVLDTNNDMSFKMRINNYRKKIDTTQVQTSEYKVDAIRTFVQRMSFPKVNEFQYTLHADEEQVIRVPLSLSGLTIKYRIGSQVR